MRKLSVVIIFFEMLREAQRTLFTLSRHYQTNCDDLEYEVIAVDNGSRGKPLTAELVKSFGPEFRFLNFATDVPSPAAALNAGANAANGDAIMLIVDGARMLSPGVFDYTVRAFRAFNCPFVYTIGMHLGPTAQNHSMLEGYNQEIEDRILDEINWRENGYLLFERSSYALSSSNGFFGRTTESNCFTMKRDTFLRIGGFEERFVETGGGLLNLDFYNRVMDQVDIEPVRLLGEASFHQFHGGAATNVPIDQHPFDRYALEYRTIRGREFTPNPRTPYFIGHAPRECAYLFPATIGARL